MSYKQGSYNIAAVNFTTYGASLMYIDAMGRALTPVYNYLKPMPAEVLEGFYESYGGLEEFSRKTASPSLGMLNSGLQALWLKRKKPEVYSKCGYRIAFSPVPGLPVYREQGIRVYLHRLSYGHVGF